MKDWLFIWTYKIAVLAALAIGLALVLPFFLVIELAWLACIEADRYRAPRRF